MCFSHLEFRTGALLLEESLVILVEVLLGLLGLLQGLDLAAYGLEGLIFCLCRNLVGEIEQTFSVSATHFDIVKVKESLELC